MIGFIPYPGTLNVRVDDEGIVRLLSRPKVEIPGFKAKNRTFGAIMCYKIRINNLDAYIVRPQRATHSKDILEIIAKDNLRDSLRLKAGSRVNLRGRLA